MTKTNTTQKANEYPTYQSWRNTHLLPDNAGSIPDPMYMYINHDLCCHNISAFEDMFIITASPNFNIVNAIMLLCISLEFYFSSTMLMWNI